MHLKACIDINLNMTSECLQKQVTCSPLLECIVQYKDWNLSRGFRFSTINVSLRLPLRDLQMLSHLKMILPRLHYWSGEAHATKGNWWSFGVTLIKTRIWQVYTHWLSTLLSAALPISPTNFFASSHKCLNKPRWFVCSQSKDSALYGSELWKLQNIFYGRWFHEWTRYDG